MKTTILALFFIFVATACNDNKHSNKVECNITEELVEGFCVAKQCSEGEVLVGGVCLNITEIPCTEDAQCMEHLDDMISNAHPGGRPNDRTFDAICLNNKCLLTEEPINECDNVLCSEGLVCEGGKCVEPPCVVPVEGDVLTNCECQTAADCTASVNPVCTTPESCKCENNLCLPISPITCEQDADCGPNGVCVDKVCQEKPITSVVNTDLIGKADGDAFDQTCKRDTFALRMKTHHGWFLDNLELGCQDALNRVTNVTKYLKPAGGTGGALETIIPPNDVMITGMKSSLCNDAKGSFPCHIQFVGKRMTVDKTSKEAIFEDKLNPSKKTNIFRKDVPWVSKIIAKAPKESFEVSNVSVACPSGKSFIGIKGTTREVENGGPTVVTSLQGVCDDTAIATSVGNLKAGASCKNDLACETAYCGSRPFRSKAAGVCEIKFLEIPLINPAILMGFNLILTDDAEPAAAAAGENGASAARPTRDAATMNAEEDVRNERGNFRRQRAEEAAPDFHRNSNF